MTDSQEDVLWAGGGEPADWRAALAEGPDAELANKVREALEELLANHGELLVRDVNEKTITGRLATCLESRFAGWNVDPEYNRDGHKTKKANGEVVVPDVIVHQRGQPAPQNLLVIEAKKSNSSEADEEDIAKLEVYKSCHLGYRHALFIKFLVGADRPGIVTCRWV